MRIIQKSTGLAGHYQYELENINYGVNIPSFIVEDTNKDPIYYVQQGYVQLEIGRIISEIIETGSFIPEPAYTCVPTEEPYTHITITIGELINTLYHVTRKDVENAHLIITGAINGCSEYNVNFLEEDPIIYRLNNPEYGIITVPVNTKDLREKINQYRNYGKI